MRDTFALKRFNSGLFVTTSLPVNVQARVDGRSLDAQLVRQLQIGPSEEVNVDADDVRKIEQHMRNVLRTAD